MTNHHRAKRDQPIPDSLATSQLLSTLVVAKIFGFSTVHIRRLVKQGKFPAPINIGGRKHGWRMSDIKSFSDGLHVTETAPEGLGAVISGDGWCARTKTVRDALSDTGHAWMKAHAAKVLVSGEDFRTAFAKRYGVIWPAVPDVVTAWDGPGAVWVMALNLMADHLDEQSARLAALEAAQPSSSPKAP